MIYLICPTCEAFRVLPEDVQRTPKHSGDELAPKARTPRFLQGRTAVDAQQRMPE